jgi:hypothetical protein
VNHQPARLHSAAKGQTCELQQLHRRRVTQALGRLQHELPIMLCAAAAFCPTIALGTGGHARLHRHAPRQAQQRASAGRAQRPRLIYREPSMQLTITTNFPEVQRALEQLHKDVAAKATASALNKTVAQAKTAMSKEIRADFNLSASTVNQSLRITRARASGGRINLEATLSSISKPGARSLNLAHFSARQTRKGVSFKIKRNGPRQVIPGSFMINGGKTVMIRSGKSRLPIEARQTINVAGMFNAKRINAKVIAMINTKFPAIFENEAKFFTDRFNARRAA